MYYKTVYSNIYWISLLDLKSQMSESNISVEEDELGWASLFYSTEALGHLQNDLTPLLTENIQIFMLFHKSKPIEPQEQKLQQPGYHNIKCYITHIVQDSDFNDLPQIM